jgi:crossover junction endodeoxyribonuclease RuvC
VSGPRVLGIDPGLKCTGYAVLENNPAGGIRLCEAGVVRGGATTLSLPVRLKALHDGIGEVFDAWHPTAIAIEQLYAHYAHPRTAVLMGHARGVFVLIGGLRDVPVVSIPSTRIKKTMTGSGRADKSQMQRAVMRELRLATPPEPHDVADAIAVAVCYLQTRGRTP